MGEQDENNGNMSVSVPMGGLALALVAGLAAAAYLMMNREEEGSGGATQRLRQSGGGMRRKLGLMTLITLIENDATRKVLLTALRAIARRS